MAIRGSLSTLVTLDHQELPPPWAFCFLILVLQICATAMRKRTLRKSQFGPNSKASCLVGTVDTSYIRPCVNHLWYKGQKKKLLDARSVR